MAGATRLLLDRIEAARAAEPSGAGERGGPSVPRRVLSAPHLVERGTRGPPPA